MHVSWTFIVSSLAAPLWLLASCNANADAPCPAGEEGCSCLADSTCEGELTCRSESCVDLALETNSSGSNSTGGTDASGGETSSGESNTASSGGRDASSGGAGAATSGGSGESAGSTASVGAGGGSSAAGSGGAGTSTTDDPTSTSGGGTSGTACPVTSDDFLEPTFDGSEFFILPAALGEANGGWVSYGDGTSNATLTLSSDSVPGGMNSILCEVSGFAEWGGCLLILGSGIDLTASGRNALQFWARAPTPYEVRVNFSDRTSDYAGGICDGEQNCFENCCHDHYGTQFTATGDWTQYTFRFDELTREDGNGPPLPFDPTHVREVGFRLVEPADFELEIDELAFVTCED